MRRFATVVATILLCVHLALINGAVAQADPTPEATAVVADPTVEPTVETTVEPTAEPTQEPTAEPTLEPTVEPTLEVTPETTPTETPVDEATPEPSPTAVPTAEQLPTPRPAKTPKAAATPERVIDRAGLGEAPTLLAVGDIAKCGRTEHVEVAKLVSERTGTLAVLGDNAYNSGTAAEYTNCYDPSWGAFLGRTKPTPGNHEYLTAGATGYYGYFGASAGTAGLGYYSYDIGTWHVIVLNSEIDMSVGSTQEKWLRADLAANDVPCTLAYWHRPRFSSGEHGNYMASFPLYKALYENGAEIVLNGHDHNYERFDPQDHLGNADAAFGIRTFVIGTGGIDLRPIDVVKPNSAFRDASTYGLVQFGLNDGGFTWEFVPIEGQSLVDSGSVTCHGKPDAVGGTTKSFRSGADSYVREKVPAENNGRLSVLKVDGDTGAAVQSYLKFTVSGLSGTVVRATVRLYVEEGTVKGPFIYKTSSSWRETTLTWANKPASSGGRLSSVDLTTTGQYIEFDVTAAVTGNGTYAFVLKPRAKDGATFSSDETSRPSRRPQLIIETK